MTDNSPGLHEALNLLLADFYALYLKAKGFHWHVAGRHFRAHHLLFDEQASQILAATDRIGERVIKTGGTTLRSVGHVARLQRIRDEDGAELGAESMLAALRDDNEGLIAAIKETKQRADEAGDNATSGLMDELTDQAEERAWFLRASLPRG